MSVNYCCFCCSGHSGHTIIAHIIDSHPDAIISEEMRVTYKIARRNWTKERIFEEIKKSSEQVARKALLYSQYKFPFGSWRYSLGCISPWQGQLRNRQVIGDKTGWDLIGPYLKDNNKNKLYIRARNRLAKKDMNMKVIVSLRNPFDLISTFYYGHLNSKRNRSTPILSEKIDYCRKFMEATQALCFDYKDELDLHVIRNEDLIANPKEEVSKLFKFLELEVDEYHLNTIKSFLFKKPRRKVDLVPWSEKDKDNVQRNIIDKYDFLRGYTFDG